MYIYCPGSSGWKWSELDAVNPGRPIQYLHYSDWNLLWFLLVAQLSPGWQPHRKKLTMTMFTSVTHDLFQQINTPQHGRQGIDFMRKESPLSVPWTLFAGGRSNFLVFQFLVTRNPKAMLTFNASGFFFFFGGGDYYLYLTQRVSFYPLFIKGSVCWACRHIFSNTLLHIFTEIWNPTWKPLIIATTSE